MTVPNTYEASRDGSRFNTADAPFHLWLAEVDGVTVIATLAVGVAEEEELVVEVAATVLSTLRSGR